MLVLSRKAEQEIVIGDCRIKILSIQGGRVRIGIEAPADVPVHRSEVLDADLCGASATAEAQVRLCLHRTRTGGTGNGLRSERGGSMAPRT